MIEYICDKCGKRITDLPEEAKKNLSGRHICKDCIRGMIREYAKKIADAPLGYAPYRLLFYIYECLSRAYLNVADIKTPYDHLKCPVCQSELQIYNALNREYACEKCMVVYDRIGNKIKDMEGKE